MRSVYSGERMFICFRARDNVKKITKLFDDVSEEKQTASIRVWFKGIEEMTHPHFLMLYMKHISQGGTNT